MRITDHPILDFERGREVQFTFEDNTLVGYEGEPVAAALQASGIRVLRYSRRLLHPRGFFCAIGNCSECLVEIDGEPNIRSCTTPLREGMHVRRQRGVGDQLDRM
ncbi:MAG: (2Fe-2S)-binding protein [Clostridia bacterium]